MSENKEFTLIKWVAILGRQFQQYINDSLKDLDLTYMEFIYLINMYENNGASQEFMSKKSFLDKAAITRNVQTLEKKGFVYREKNKDDKRINNVFLTEKAFSYKDKLNEIINNWEEGTYKCLTKDRCMDIGMDLEVLTRRVVDKLNQ